MQPREAEFCSNCGYHFNAINQGDGEEDTSKKKSQSTRESLQHSKPKHSHSKAYLLIGIIAVIIIVVGFATVQVNNHKATETASSSSVTSSRSSKTSKVSSKKSSSSKQDANTSNLTTNIDPKQNGAAIAYYAMQNAGWKDIVNQNEGITIRTSTGLAILNRLKAKGQSMTYEVFKGQNIANNAKSSFVYTIDSNGNINLYNLPADQNATNIAPVKTISRDDITKYINEHHQANDVRTLSSKVTVVKANN